MRNNENNKKKTNKKLGSIEVTPVSSPKGGKRGKKGSIGSNDGNTSKVKEKLWDGKGCTGNTMALLFSWIQLLSGLFTFHALFVGATMESHKGRCNKNKCCKLVSIIAFVELVVRLGFIAVTYMFIIDEEARFYGTFVVSGILCFAGFALSGLIFFLLVCCVKQPLKRAM